MSSRSQRISAAFFFFFLTVSFSLSLAVPTHLDKTKLKKGCSECHKGHGKRASMLLSQSKEELCFSCHGPSAKNSSIGKNSADIYSVLMKSSSHPVIQTSHLHQSGERLPDSAVGAQRHVSCFDCHNVHKAEKGSSIKGLKGYSGRGIRTKQANYEYELCYTCHSDQGTSSGAGGDVSLEFERINPSFHPVETFGKNSFVPSLRGNYTRSSIITCSDCHGNDDSLGPKGPHGSRYEPILKYRYVRTQGPESSSSYELCYTCHDRNSILNDQSFKAHKIHVVYNQISCGQCHSAHGSRFSPSLINFATAVVFPNSTGEITFMPMAQGRPRCYLSCHINGKAVEHKLNQTLTYSVNNRVLSQW
ncbi:MAG: hypothetical protein HZB31_05865 [Nitrospirae bacterium]|nr:hypothetical protein [Nitrospirota bacterium]